MQKLLPLAILIASFNSFSQTIQGTIYDDEAIVSGVQIINRTQNVLSYSDTKGKFKIEASLNDSIVFKSLFHLEKKMKITKLDFDRVLVIELKKSVNDLDEVVIIKEADFKPFNPIETNIELKNQIQEDIRLNPYLYQKNLTKNGNILGVLGLVAKLFKSKKPKEVGIVFTTYDDLVQLFETNSYFNSKFLITELKIENDYKFLFLQFCEAKSINSKLLLPDNQFMLLDTFLTYSNEFLEILNAEQKD